MRLVTYHKDRSIRSGAVIRYDGCDYLADLNQSDPHLPADMLTLLSMGDAGFKLAKAALGRLLHQDLVPLSEVRLGPPVPKPPKIICLGLNYRDHAEEGGQTVPQYPTVFSKYASCVIGPEAPIVVPRFTDQVDFEAELAVVIGKCCKDVLPDQALGYVAGYTAFNDVSARDYQARTSQWTLGKTFDSFGPMGPVMVSRDEIPDPGCLEIALVLNGQVMQHSNTRHLIFSIPFLISYLSQVMTLEPGDVISTGTPAGVGVHRNPPVFLTPGDRVEVHIEKIGVLINSVIAG